MSKITTKVELTEDCQVVYGSRFVYLLEEVNCDAGWEEAFLFVQTSNKQNFVKWLGTEDLLWTGHPSELEFFYKRAISLIQQGIPLDIILNEIELEEELEFFHKRAISLIRQGVPLDIVFNEIELEEDACVYGNMKVSNDISSKKIAKEETKETTVSNNNHKENHEGMVYNPISDTWSWGF